MAFYMGNTVPMLTLTLLSWYCIVTQSLTNVT